MSLGDFGYISIIPYLIRNNILLVGVETKLFLDLLDVIGYNNHGKSVNVYFTDLQIENKDMTCEFIPERGAP